MHTAHETWLIFRRAMQQALRNPAWVVITLVQPVLYLALFVPLLQSLVGAPGFPPGDEWQVMVPALLVQLALFGTAFVGYGLIAEYRSGVIERMRVTPVSRTALLLGRSLRDVVVLTVQGALLITLAVPFGLRTPISGALLSLALVAVLGLAMSAASYGLALKLKSEDAFAPVQNSIIVPVLLLSGVLLPMSLAPAWLFTVSRFNPFVYVVDATRAAFVGDLASTTVALGVLAAVALSVAAVTFGIRTFQRENA
ncbi:MAG TPA: ABC transporter permease [Pseudonocardiaceae bacterium]|nr:ABC transporter permease [Pseudonocardiaceae bacterium]